MVSIDSAKISRLATAVQARAACLKSLLSFGLSANKGRILPTKNKATL